MVIEKNGKTYIISECKNHWTIKYSMDGLSINYEVDKKLCKKETDLREYIKQEEMF